MDDKVKLPVAIVGAGGIVDGAHLPAYKKAGVEVIGIFDTDNS
ncbi:MAG: gfo/Idh/MocA family oxidoreductase, partial [Actinobacteria bacterium]|nr:gfo/Idh/MocA family oxidoreductase [Actinomycetota bacterium]